MTTPSTANSAELVGDAADRGRAQLGDEIGGGVGLESWAANALEPSSPYSSPSIKAITTPVPGRAAATSWAARSTPAAPPPLSAAAWNQPSMCPSSTTYCDDPGNGRRTPTTLW